MKKIMIVCGVLLFQACFAAKEFDASKVATLVSGQNQFAFALFDELSSPGENTFISPYSIHTALSMTYEGARGKTATEMAGVLHPIENAAVRHNATQEFYDYLMNLGASCQKKPKQSSMPLVIKVANGLWVEKTHKLLPSYIDVVTEAYNAQAKNIDFKKKSEIARKKINEWVAKATENKIENLFEGDSINDTTELVLVNAIYFRGLWEKQFDATKTLKDQPFYDEQQQKIGTVSLMCMIGNNAQFKYAKIQDAQVLEMPYSCNNLSMVILLPKVGTLSALEQKLNKENIQKWLDLADKQRVDVYVPRFKVSTKYELNEPLKALGMPLAFSGTADFSGIDGSKSLSISLVVHQAFVEVNEEGTEAAAATGVVVTKLAPMRPQEIPTFRADHSFIFVIRENTTGTLLFMGKVVKP